MMRMGIDYGRARIGIAIGAFIAKEYATIVNNEDALSKIVDIINKESVDEVIIGHPVRSRGEDGTMSDEIKSFRQRLALKLPKIQIAVVDEAFTSTQAEIELKELGVKGSEIKDRIDQYAAQLILDQYNNDHPGEL